MIERYVAALDLEISNEAERDDVLVEIRILNALENVEHLFFSDWSVLFLYSK